ncbi:MAG: hypothetical protein WCP39_05865 [Chlamydiota bacterium]
MYIPFLKRGLCLFNSKFNETAYNFQKEEAVKSYESAIKEIEDKKEKEIKKENYWAKMPFPWMKNVYSP